MTVDRCAKLSCVMSLLSHVFSILGDSNIKRHMNPINCRDRPMMSGCQVLPCEKLSVLAETLKAVRVESNVVLIACLTNFLTSIDGSISASVSGKIAPLLSLIVESLKSVCQDNPNRFHLISAPMYRDHPVWYREGLPEILIAFSQSMTPDRPPNL